MTTPPCAGRWKLFDSTDPHDHQTAAAICATCPMIEACRTQLAATRADAHGHYGPQGTWAGQLVNTIAPGRPTLREDEYDGAEARKARAAYNRGERTEWAILGHRAYERARKRRQRAARGEAA